MHLLHIAIVFWGVNYCILQYSIAFLAAIAIAIAIDLMAIANALIEMYKKGKCIAKSAFNWKSIGKFCNDSFCISYQKQKKETVKQSAVNFWRLPESTRVTANYEIATPLVSSTQAIITTIISGFLPNIHGLEWEIK